jgi:transcriptional regulator with XRE-family HTH domain
MARWIADVLITPDNNLGYIGVNTKVMATDFAGAFTLPGMIKGSEIRAAREAKGMSQADLARIIGVTQPAIQKIERGDVVKSKHLQDIARALDIGDGAQSVPVISWVQAGGMHDPGVVLDAGECEAFATGPLPSGDWIALRVEGDSMDRISPPESVILVNRREKRLVPNACYVIADESGAATYKRYRPSPDRFEPVSINPAHEPIFPDGKVSIIGRVRRTILEM